MGYALLKEKPLLGQKTARPRLSARERAASRWFSKEKPAVKSNFASGRIVYNLNRYYDSSTGRYITSDRMGLVAGLNTYLYVSANPLSLIDPDGELGIAPLVLFSAIVFTSLRLLNDEFQERLQQIKEMNEDSQFIIDNITDPTINTSELQNFQSDVVTNVTEVLPQAVETLNTVGLQGLSGNSGNKGLGLMNGISSLNIKIKNLFSENVKPEEICE